MSIATYLLLFIGLPYIYKGNNPLTGFDCSGLVCEGLRIKGIVGYKEDLCSQDIYHRLLENGLYAPQGIKKDAILFFGKSISQITHVAVAVDQFTMIEAGGGDSTCTTEEEAARRNAFVRLRPITMRRDLVAVLTPTIGG